MPGGSTRGVAQAKAARRYANTRPRHITCYKRRRSPRERVLQPPPGTLRVPIGGGWPESHAISSAQTDFVTRHVPGVTRLRIAGVAAVIQASARSASSSSQSTGTSRYTPIQPRCPTYGGRKNRSGAAATSVSWAPGGPASHAARRSSWCRSAVVTNWREPTNQLASPWLARSDVSGSARQIARSRA